MQQKPRVFTKTIDGQTQTQRVVGAADAVRLTFDGWREVQPPAAPAEPSAEPADATPAADDDQSAAKAATRVTEKKK